MKSLLEVVVLNGAWLYIFGLYKKEIPEQHDSDADGKSCAMHTFITADFCFVFSVGRMYSRITLSCIHLLFPMCYA